jgi:murein DD-endopeptidase MepM/ murein hydrolase activator NlpD
MRGLMVPVDGVEPSRVPDTYSAPRGESSHNALDILAPRGTPVVAAEAGRVFRLSSNPSGGITVYAVDREERFMYYYAHLSGYRDGLREGMPLEEGDVIGYVGTTGNAPPNTPHLHFQVMKYRRDGRYWDGTPIDPHPYLRRRGAARAP